jgi:hypothetical protein
MHISGQKIRMLSGINMPTWQYMPFVASWSRAMKIERTGWRLRINYGGLKTFLLEMG